LINSPSILDVVATDLLQIAIVSAVNSDELSDHSEWASRVNCKTSTATVKVFVAARISVEPATVRIALGAASITSVGCVDSGCLFLKIN